MPAAAQSIEKADSISALKVNQLKEMEIASRTWGKIKVPIGPFIDAYSIQTSSIVYQNQKGIFLYLILAVEGPSRSPEGAMHECGAGTESDLIWLRLDAQDAYKLRGANALLYSSCFRTIEGEYKIEKQKLLIEYQSYSTQRKETWEFQFQSPENGFILQSSKQ